MFTHPCLKCGASYQDSDPDPYYCEPCTVERKKLAAKIDRKMRGHTSTLPTKSDYQIFVEQGKTYTAPTGRTITFMKG